MTGIIHCTQCAQQLQAGVRGLCSACLAATAFGLTEEEGLEPGSGAGLPGHPQQLGDYELLDELGRGGMGVVYRARQRSLDREVALKVVAAGPLADPDVVRRFRAEAKAAARLHHPHVVPVYDVGETDNYAFFSMELITGPTLSQRVRGSGPLPPRPAAVCIAKIAGALQHAHDTGLLHRDLKPSNILMDPEDEPRVADFGLAKSVTGMTDGELTLTNQTVGTPAWFAPEQAASGEALTVQTDVYGLGALLYFTLTGRSPFPGRDMARLLQQVQEEEPVPPRVLDSSIPRDVETICLKAMEKAPARRYATARDMAQDLGSWLAGDPIEARPLSRTAKAWRWVHRHRALSASLAALLLVLTGSTAGMSLLWVRADHAATAEATHRLRAEDELWNSLVTTARRERSSLLAGGSQRAMEAVRRAAAIRPGIELRDEAIAALAMPDFGTPQHSQWQGKLPKLGLDPIFSPDLLSVCLVRKDGSMLLADAHTGHEQHPFHGLPLVASGNPPQIPLPPEFSPTGRWLHALGSAPRAELAPGIFIASPAGKALAGLAGEAFAGNLARNIAGAFTSPCNLRVWSVVDGNELSLQTTPGVIEAHWSADDSILALLRRDSLERLAMPEGRSMGSIPIRPGWGSPALSSDGSRIALAYDKIVEIHSTGSGVLEHTLSQQQPAFVSAWNADDTLLAVGALDCRIHVWDTATGLKWAECNGHDSRPSLLEFLPGSGLLFSAGWDKTVRLWNPRTGRPIRSEPFADSEAVVSRGGGSIVSFQGWPVVSTRTIRPPNFLRTARAPASPAGAESGAQDAAFSSDGRLLFAGTTRGVCVWESSSLHFLGLLPCAGSAISVMPGADRALTVSIFGGGVMKVPLEWQPGQPTVRFGSPVPSGPAGTCNHADQSGRFLAVSCVTAQELYGQRVELWRDGAFLRTYSAESVWPWNASVRWPSVALSPDGEWLATGGIHLSRPLLFRTAEDAPANRSAALLEKTAQIGADCAFSPDSRTLAVAGTAHTSLWDVKTRALRHRIPRPPGATQFYVAFSPDGQLLATMGAQSEIMLIDPTTGTPLATLTPPEPCMTGRLVFSPDSTLLAATLVNDTMQVWNLAALREKLAPEGLNW